MIPRIQSRQLTSLFVIGILLHIPLVKPFAQRKSPKASLPVSSKAALGAPLPLLLKLELTAQQYKDQFESGLADLDRELKEVPRQMSRKGMDAMELAIAQIDPENMLSLGLTVKNFVPESSGVWDKQDVLFFQAFEGPVYLNLSLLQGLLKPLANYRTRILAKPTGASLPLEVWRVTLEKKNGWSIRFGGRFQENQPVIHPSLFIRRAGSDLEIKAEGYEVAQAISRATFPLPPLKILGGQFSSTKLVMEFFGKD
jgi:hypothetical protein